MVMLGNYSVLPSYSAAAPLRLGMAGPTNSQSGGKPLNLSRANGTKISTPGRSCDTEQARSVEAGGCSDLPRPLATYKELIRDVDQGVCTEPGCSSDVSELPKGRPSTSITCSPGMMPQDSVDSPPRSPHQKALPDRASASESDQPELSQSLESSESTATPHSTLDDSGHTAGHPSSTHYLYDFMIICHPDDEQESECIYNLLERELSLNGYQYSRDKTGGNYMLREMIKAIQNCRKVFLFVTPRSLKCSMFERHMHCSLNNSIESNRKNVIPVYWQLSRDKGPSVMRGIYSLVYDGCSDEFRKQMMRIFALSQSSTSSMPRSSRRDRGAPCASSPKLTHSMSPLSGTRKFFRWFSSKK